MFIAARYHLNFIFNGPSDIKTWPSIILFLPSTFSWLHLTSLWLLCLRYKMLPINCDLWTSNHINSGMWSQTYPGFQCFNTIHNEDSWLDQLTNVLNREWERLEYYERENEAIADLLDSGKKWFMWLQFVSGPVLFPVFARAISGAVICCHLIWTVREKPVAARGEILLNITSDINYVLTIKSSGRKPISSSSHHKLGYCCYCL